MKIVFLSEIVDVSSVDIDLENIEYLFNDDTSEIIVILSDTSFEIINGTKFYLIIFSQYGKICSK